MKVLITGITGTLGHALAERFHDEWDIVGFSRDELKQADMERKYPDIKFVIGDVRDYHAVYKAMKGVDAVIHAAAMKRIEACEKHPIEAFKTNVHGTENVAEAAYHHEVQKAVVIGSDKGVEPVNAYGMSKAMQEKIFISYGYNAVRYGNVFGSRGSVVPLFMDLAKRGESLRVTDPDMTRFMLPVNDAVELIVKALNSPMKGDIYIKKSPATRLIDIAKAFSDDIKIVSRMVGEKQHEMLISSSETTRMKEIDNGFVVISLEDVGGESKEAYTSNKERILSMEEIKELVARYIK